MPSSSRTEMAIRARSEFINWIHHSVATLSESEVFLDSFQFHLGLMVLRMTALIVLFSWGWPQLYGVLSTVFTGKPLSSSQFVTFVGKLGFPFPVFLGFCAILNESIGMAALSIGIFGRVVAVIATLEMAGALYAKARLGGDLLTTALCVVVFASMTVLGPGRYSIDHFISRHLKVQILSRYLEAPKALTDAGLLLLRIGVSLAMIGTVIWSDFRLTNLPAVVLLYTVAYFSIVGGFFVTLGLWTRISCTLLSLVCLVSMLISVYFTNGWQSFGVRALLLALVFGSLALMGAGRLSIDALKQDFHVATSHEE